MLALLWIKEVNSIVYKVDNLTWYCVCVKLDNGTAFRSVPIPCIWLLRQVGSLFPFCCTSNKSNTCQASPKLVKQVQNLSSKSKACQANSKLSSKSKTCQTNPKLVNQVQNWSGKSKTCQASGALKFLKVKGILWSILQFVCVASGKTLSSGQFGTSDNLTLGTIWHLGQFDT